MTVRSDEALERIGDALERIGNGVRALAFLLCALASVSFFAFLVWASR